MTNQGGSMFMLEEIVPWGRSLDEYRRMFSLTDADRRRRLIGCADGPASFNAQWTEAGGGVVSCDPLYCFPKAEIARRIDETFAGVIDQARKNIDQFVWPDWLPDPDALARHRRATMDRFLADYESGRHEGRYVAAELPGLPFPADSFDLAVCSHFLFLYSEQLSAQFHLESIRSLIQLAKEVRIFPLQEFDATPSRHLESVITRLRCDGCQVTIEVVDYEFQRGGNQMMRIGR